MVDPKANNKKEIVENIKEDEHDYNYESSNNDYLKQKLTGNLYKIAIVTVVLIVVLFLLSSIVGGKKSYSEVEDIMALAAKKYYMNHKSLLPKVTGATVEISAQKLINEDYMKDLDKYRKNSSCRGKVVVENNDDNYIYVSYLDCGEDYKTTEFYRKITEKENIVTSDAGLYYNGGEYIFRGEAVNNYVSINDQLWRIVKVTRDNEIALIKQDRVSRESFSWDDRYNSEKDGIVGINSFEVSRLKEYFQKIYDDNEDDEEEKVFTENVKAHLVNHKYCIGKRGMDDTSKDGSTECTNLSSDIKVGGLALYEYMMASLDNGCNKTGDEACQNYNYLVNDNISWWLITADNSLTYKAYYVDDFGSVDVSNTVNLKKLRPVIYLNSRTMFKSGDGTLAKPYIIK